MVFVICQLGAGAPIVLCTDQNAMFQRLLYVRNDIVGQCFRLSHA